MTIAERLRNAHQPHRHDSNCTMSCPQAVDPWDPEYSGYCGPPATRCDCGINTHNTLLDEAADALEDTNTRIVEAVESVPWHDHDGHHMIAIADLYRHLHIEQHTRCRPADQGNSR